jgi:hypothetical protein
LAGECGVAGGCPAALCHGIGGAYGANSGGWRW